MVRTCCIKDCGSQWWPGTEISFHRFPKKEELRSRWLNNISPSNLSVNINLTYAAVCSKHFTEDAFGNCLSLRNVLKRDAVPTLFGADTTPEYVDFEILSDYSDEENLPENIPVMTSPKTRNVGIQTVSNNRTLNDIDEYKRREKILKKRLERAELKIQELDTILKAQMQGTEIDIIASAINKYIPEDRRDIFLNELSHHVPPFMKKIYESNIKEFALRIYLTSKPAYDYLREKMTLPHPMTIRKWLS